MMKAKDCSVATALVINGYLRANVDNGEEANPNENQHLVAAIGAIRQECDDWAENLASDDQAVDAKSIQVAMTDARGGPVARSPYNLVEGALSLVLEAVDVGGPDVIAHLLARIQSVRS